MAYTEKNYQTKAELKKDLAAGIKIRCYQPGLGPDLTNYSGRVTLEGPHYPKPHKWYGAATLKDGVVVSIK